VASWGTALVFLAVTLPLALWCYLEGGLSVVRVAGVYLVTALLLGVVCAISLGLSALLARSTTSGVLAYLTVFALSAGTALAFGLITATTQQEVPHTEQICDAAGSCTDSSFTTTLARPDRTWWLVAPNPFVVLADSAPAGPVRRVRLPNGDVLEEPDSVDVLGSLSRSLHRIRATPAAIQDESGTRYEVPDGVTGGPVWPLGLGIDLALAVGAMWVATVRLRTPTARLARGQRIA
jgi:ABC-2 type transport system permease protein